MMVIGECYIICELLALCMKITEHFDIMFELLALCLYLAFDLFGAIITQFMHGLRLLLGEGDN